MQIVFFFFNYFAASSIDISKIVQIMLSDIVHFTNIFNLSFDKVYYLITNCLVLYFIKLMLQEAQSHNCIKFPLVKQQM